MAGINFSLDANKYRMDSLKPQLFMACSIYLLNSAIGFHISAYNRNGLQDNYISPFSIDNPSSYLFETLFNKKPIIEYGEPSMMAMEYQFYPDFSDITNAIEYSNQLPSENVYNLVSKRHPRRHKARAERQNGNINLCRKVHTFSELYRMCQRLLMGERNTRRRGLRNYRRQNTRKISMT